MSVVGRSMGGMPEPASTSPVPPERATPDADQVFRDEDRYGEELVEQAWSRCTFFDSDWTEVVNERSAFDGCTFSGVRFNASRHTGAAITNCTFRRCTFFDTVFTDCKLVGSVFQQSSFTLLRVFGGDWSFAGLRGSDLCRAAFEGVRMREVDLTSARLEKASVTESDLSGAMLSGANLTGADLRGSDLSALDPFTVELRDALIGPGQAAVIAGALGLRVL